MSFSTLANSASLFPAFKSRLEPASCSTGATTLFLKQAQVLGLSDSVVTTPAHSPSPHLWQQENRGLSWEMVCRHLSLLLFMHKYSMRKHASSHQTMPPSHRFAFSPISKAVKNNKLKLIHLLDLPVGFDSSFSCLLGKKNSLNRYSLV